MKVINNDKQKLLRNSKPGEIKPGLERISELLSRLDNPQDQVSLLNPASGLAGFVRLRSKNNGIVSGS